MIGVQVKQPDSGQWSTIEATASAISGAFNYSDAYLSTIVYLPAGTVIRAVVSGAPAARLGRGSSTPSLVIYLLSAADAPQ
jgi:hypothetical protein